MHKSIRHVIESSSEDDDKGSCKAERTSSKVYSTPVTSRNDDGDTRRVILIDNKDRKTLVVERTKTEHSMPLNISSKDTKAMYRTPVRSNTFGSDSSEDDSDIDSKHHRHPDKYSSDTNSSLALRKRQLFSVKSKSEQCNYSVPKYYKWEGKIAKSAEISKRLFTKTQLSKSYSDCCSSHDDVQSDKNRDVHHRLDFSYLSRRSDSGRIVSDSHQEHPAFHGLIKRSQHYVSTFIDSHCHIDFLYKRLKIDKTTHLSQFFQSRKSSLPSNFEGCIAVFCDPNTFKIEDAQDEIFRTLTEEEDIPVWFAFGCHPKNATRFNRQHEEGLKQYLRHPKVVALGEIGLDYSGNFHQFADIQKRVFKTQLRLAMDMHLPLVIHCRDADDDCLTIMTELVPGNYKIHLHCFTRDMFVASRWLSAFKNMYIGLTPVITLKSAMEPMSVAAKIPLNRLLLETDAPYFVPSQYKGLMEFSHPGMALATAEKVAELRGTSTEAVLKACRENTFSMYGV